MTPINKFHRNQLIKRIVKKIEKAFDKEVDDLCDIYGGSADYGDVCRIWASRDTAIEALETFKKKGG
tara:strand:+ start:215 stop:415 length:201 start_codon:yes stop_codon:yes gene_type:complete